MTLRRATLDDARAIARLHVASWRESYVGLVPQKMLDELCPTEREAVWKRILSGPPGDRAAIVHLETEAGELCGFVATETQRTPDLALAGYTGEITSIYVRKVSQRRGVGRRLMSAAVRDLAEAGHEAVALWVLAGNTPARRFYEDIGCVVIANQQDRRDAVVLAEIAYGWRQIRSFLEA